MWIQDVASNVFTTGYHMNTASHFHCRITRFLA
jgi:hypothetical protein